MTETESPQTRSRNLLVSFDLFTRICITIYFFKKICFFTSFAPTQSMAPFGLKHVGNFVCLEALPLMLSNALLVSKPCPLLYSSHIGPGLLSSTICVWDFPASQLAAPTLLLLSSVGLSDCVSCIPHSWFAPETDVLTCWGGFHLPFAG